jgi:hypothetical protein
MAQRRRKTKTELRQDFLDKQSRCWDEFEPKLAALNSMADALALQSHAPAPDTPCHKYYSNFGFFLICFSVPFGANYTKLQLYLQLIRKLAASGELPGESSEKIELALISAIKSKGQWDAD